MDAARMKEDMRQAGQSLRDNLARNLGRVQETVEENVRQGFGQTQGMFAGLSGQLGTLVRDSPIMALGGAFAIGYVVAKVARAMK